MSANASFSESMKYVQFFLILTNFEEIYCKTATGESPVKDYGFDVGIERAGTVQPEDKALGVLISVHKYMMGGCWEYDTRLFSMLLTDRTRDSWPKPSEFWEILCQWHSLPWGCGVSIVSGIQMPSGHSPGQLAQTGWTRWPLENLSNLKHSVVVWP